MHGPRRIRFGGFQVAISPELVIDALDDGSQHRRPDFERSQQNRSTVLPAGHLGEEGVQTRVTEVRVSWSWQVPPRKPHQQWKPVPGGQSPPIRPEVPSNTRCDPKMNILFLDLHLSPYASTGDVAKHCAFFTIYLRASFPT